jgi:prevent-host-death family protein
LKENAIFGVWRMVYYGKKGGNTTATTVSKFRKNMSSYFKQAVRFNEPVIITSNEGNAVVLSEEEYSSMVETLYLLSVPGMKKKIIDASNEPISQCVPLDEVEW